MARRTLTPAVVVATLALSSTHAAAQGFAVNRFEPSERGSDWFGNESLDLRGSARPAFGAVGDYSYRPLVVYGPDGNVRNSIVRNNLFAHLGAAVTFANRFRLSTSLPLQLYTDGSQGTLAGGTTLEAPPNEQDIGDLRLGADARLFGKYGDPITLAFGAQIWFPTGQKAQYTSDGTVRFRPRAMVAGDVGIFTYAAQLGVAYRGRSETVGGGAIGSEMLFAAAAGLRLADKKLTVGPEILGSTVFDDAFAEKATPFEALFGAHYALRNARFGAGIGPGLSRGFGAPQLRALLSFELFQAVVTDTDKDGILDPDDACPTAPGEPNEDPKKNGCRPEAAPVPADRDGDGILDRDDACVFVKGVKTDNPTTNGCPADTDGDGIVDTADACPTVKGIASDDKRQNGCPDRDHDGVFDPDDACPDEAGPATSDPKTNGCPDPDRDKDGIPNDKDACPDEPGKPDPEPNKNGCPRVFVQGKQIRILDQVKFKTGSAEIVAGPESEGVLSLVQQALTQHPEIKKVRVEGHTDNRGQAARNKKLSNDRAASVVKWLVAHGVEASRLSSVGLGADKPVDSNATDAGRRNNRRVEFHIVDESAGGAK